MRHEGIFCKCGKTEAEFVNCRLQFPIGHMDKQCADHDMTYPLEISDSVMEAFGVAESQLQWYHIAPKNREKFKRHWKKMVEAAIKQYLHEQENK